jgi:hypothetical protein
MRPYQIGSNEAVAPGKNRSGRPDLLVREGGTGQAGAGADDSRQWWREVLVAEATSMRRSSRSRHRQPLDHAAAREQHEE